MDDGRVAEVVALVRESGALERAEAYASRYTDRALSEIGRLPEGEARRNLSQLAGKLLSRGW